MVVALGSNLGDRRAHLQYAVSRLGECLREILVSAFIETPPKEPSPPGSPTFLNAVMVGWSAESPATQLRRLHRIEDDRGRCRTVPGAARTLDVDLILVGDLVVDTTTLTVPHPRFRERDFVLGPLASIAPELIDPVSGISIRELFAQLRANGLSTA